MEADTDFFSFSSSPSLFNLLAAAAAAAAIVVAGGGGGFARPVTFLLRQICLYP